MAEKNTAADGLSAQIGAILNDPQAMEQLKQAAAGLFGGDAAADGNGNNDSALAKTDMSGLAGLLGQPELAAGLAGLLGGERKKPEPAVPANALDPQMLQTIMKLAPLLSNAQQDDDTTRLLYALRPLLGQTRRKKLDEAVKMVKMMTVLPLLKGSGVLENLL